MLNVFSVREKTCALFGKNHICFEYMVHELVRRIILSPVLPSAMYNFHLQIKPSIKDTYARLGVPLHLELGFGNTI